MYLEDVELEAKYNARFEKTLAELEIAENRERFPLGSGLIATGNPRRVV